MFPFRHLESEQRQAEFTYVLRKGSCVQRISGELIKASSHLCPALVRATGTVHRSLYKCLSTASVPATTIQGVPVCNAQTYAVLALP